MLLLGYDLLFPGGWIYLYFFLDHSILATFLIAMIVKTTNYAIPQDADLTLGNTKKEIDDYDTLSELQNEKEPGKWYERIMERIME